MYTGFTKSARVTDLTAKQFQIHHLATALACWLGASCTVSFSLHHVAHYGMLLAWQPQSTSSHTRSQSLLNISFVRRGAKDVEKPVSAWEKIALTNVHTLQSPAGEVKEPERLQGINALPLSYWWPSEHIIIYPTSSGGVPNQGNQQLMLLARQSCMLLMCSITIRGPHLCYQQCWKTLL